MAKQKIVIKVSMNSQKLRSTAMTIVVGVSGVESAAIKGDSKDQIEVTGEQIDAATLTNLLRKKFCHAELVSVGEVEKKEVKKVDTKEEPVVAWPCACVASISHYPVPVCEIRNLCQCDEPSCSIM